MHPQNLVCFLVREHFHQTFVVVVGLGARVCKEGEHSLRVLNACFFQLLLGFADVGHFGVGVDHSGDGIVVDVTALAGHVLYCGDAFLLGLVCQHWPADNISDSEDVRDIAL